MTGLPTVVIASRRDNGDWRDLDVLLASLDAYAAELARTVALQGPGALGRHGAITQPDSCSTFGAAYGWAVSQAGPGPYILCNDDVIWQPHTLTRLLADVAKLAGSGRQHGFVACRSNFVRLNPPHCVSPVCAYVTAEALAVTEWPDCNWYSDDVMCWDMVRAGYHHYVSPAEVFHLGERSTRGHGQTREQLETEGRAWVWANRPDAALALGLPRPEEVNV